MHWVHKMKCNIKTLGITTGTCNSPTRLCRVAMHTATRGDVDSDVSVPVNITAMSDQLNTVEMKALALLNLQLIHFIP